MFCAEHSVVGSSSYKLCRLRILLLGLEFKSRDTGAYFVMLSSFVAVIVTHAHAKW